MLPAILGHTHAAGRWWWGRRHALGVRDYVHLSSQSHHRSRPYSP
jgi:hypothetical protein